MSKASDQDVEALLRGAAFPNPTHKESLHSRLFGDMQTLELDDLALAAGGLNVPFVSPENWPDTEQKGAY